MENIEKGELITTGKAKSLYQSNQQDYLVMHYRDDTSAFDGKKIESLEKRLAETESKLNSLISVIHSDLQRGHTLGPEGLAAKLRKSGLV